MDTQRKTSDTERMLRNARSRIELLIEQGEPEAAALVLSENPELANDQESSIELIYAEFLALEAHGRLPDSNSWLDRFPVHRPRLERLLKLHDFLSVDQPASAQGIVGNSADRVPEKDVATQPFAKYELLDEIGRGGMGIVYRARQQGLGRIVALKVLRLIENHPKVRSRFQHEAETVASLQHPNIVQVIEISLDEGKEFLSMEYLGGGSLESKLLERNWSNHEIAQLIETLAQAIHYAHQRGIIHRDLKPANILFTTERTPKIVDFGLAKKIQDELHTTVTGAVLGTPCYMSPEQAAGDDAPLGPATDIYSLGIILYQMLTGRLPFEGKTALETLRWIVDRECEPPSKRTSGVPRDLETICLKCLAKSPIARYETAQALAEDLARFLDHVPILARRANWVERLGRRIQRHPQVAALAGSIMAVGIGAATIVYFQNRTVDQLSRENALHLKSAAELRERVSEVENAHEISLRKARASVNEWTQLGLRLDNEPGMDGLRRKAFEDAVAYYKECMAANIADDAIRLEAAVAAIQAAYFHTDLGQYETAESELLLADKWLTTLPVDHGVKWNQSDIQVLLANILRRMDRWDESSQAYMQSIKIIDELLQKHPNNTSYLIRQANALLNLCVVLNHRTEWDESLRTYLRAIRLSTKAAAIRAKENIPDFLTQKAAGDSSEVSSGLNEVTEYLTEVCDRLRTQNPALLKALAKENYLSEIALCLDDAGQVFEIKSQVAQAERSYRDAIRLRKLTQNLAQENRRIDQFLARSETNLGKLLLTHGRFEEARTSLHEAEQAYSKLVNDFPERMDCRQEWSQCLLTLAKCGRLQQDISQAVQYAGQATQQLQIAYKQAKSLAIQDSCAIAMFAHSHFLQLSGDEEKAEQIFSKAREMASERAVPCNSHAWMLALEDKPSDSTKNVALQLSEVATNLSPQSSYLWNTRALALARSERWQECLEAIDKAISLTKEGTPSDWFIKSMALAGNREFEAAKHWFSIAESVRSSKSPNHSELRKQSQLAQTILLRDKPE